MSLDYSHEAIDHILRGSSKQLMRLLDLRNLTRVRQVLKKVVERQRVPSYMEEFLLCILQG